VFEHQIGQRRIGRARAARIEGRLRPRVRPILEDRFEEARGQRLPLAPRRGRQTMKLFAETAEQVFERERAGAVERAVQR
jgi:hypothetical protein